MECLFEEINPKDSRLSVGNLFFLKLTVRFRWLQSLCSALQHVEAHQAQPQENNCRQLEAVHDKMRDKRVDAARRVLGAKNLWSTTTRASTDARSQKREKETDMAFPRAQATKTKLEATTCLVRYRVESVKFLHASADTYARDL